ncbi:hypothetical protein ACLKA7_002109 [Drosophila subpalustris]
MVEITHRLTHEIEKGLAKATHPQANVKCYVSYVQDLPTGAERGKFLGLDLGGTHFRCILIDLKGGLEIQAAIKKFVISDTMMKGPGRNLFHFIAESLAGFCKEQNIDEEELPLGFTFSFPLQQIGINKGILTIWTKGFQCEGVVGTDVVEKLQKAIDRRGDIRVKVVAIINDSTGTLVTCARGYKDSRIGFIVGTGVNACYMEKTSNAEMFEDHKTSKKPYMIINTELGAFGENGALDLIRTIYDKSIDLQTPNPEKQTFEKCTSGMYLGEVVRHVVVDLMRMGVLFRGQPTEIIGQKWIFTTQYVSEIESDPPGKYHSARLVLDQVGIRSDSEPDLECLRYVCESVTMRSARLIACAIATLVNKMNVEECTVGLDGGLFRFHPHYRERIEDKLTLLLGNSKKVKLVLVEDGSGFGAALVAATSPSHRETFEICKIFRIPKDKMVEITHRLTHEIEKGLAKATHPQANVKCYVSYVQDLPTGAERGKFLGLDLGGTHFRCILIDLKGGLEIQAAIKKFVVSETMMKGPGHNLFHFIAESLAGFCKEQKIDEEELPLGFTFSFPLQQKGINNGILTIWTKGFQCEGVVGTDVVEKLQKAIDERGDIRVKVVAIINDSTGTLVTCARGYKDSRIGFIVGTGVSACYMEKTSNAEMFEDHKTSEKPYMIINTELGAFGENGALNFVRTIYDKNIDLQTPNPEKQTFEKCTSGMYLGEVVRHVVVDLMRMGVLFRGQPTEIIGQKWIFTTQYVSEIESDPPGKYQNARLVLDQVGIRSDSEPDLECLRYVCESVTMRSARLIACAIATLVNKMNVEECTVGLDGGLFRFHPHYRERIEDKLTLLLGNSKKVKLVLVEDGSGFGAALVAANALRHKETTTKTTKYKKKIK